MKQEDKDKIIAWIGQNHQHHSEIELITDTVVPVCIDNNFPYVNSIDLVNFIKSL